VALKPEKAADEALVLGNLWGLVFDRDIVIRNAVDYKT
jgi:hypothetical protein